MFDEQELLTLSYGLVTLLSELDGKRRKFYVRWTRLTFQPRPVLHRRGLSLSRNSHNFTVVSLIIKVLYAWNL